MALRADYEFLFVGRDDNSFLENYYYDLFQDYGDKSGQIFINLEVQNNPVDAEEIGGVIFETMQRVFFEDVDRDPYERFEVSLKAVNEMLGKFKEQKFSGYIGNLNVIISAIVGDVLYLAQAGDAEAYLIRKKYVSVVSEGLNEEASDGDFFTTIASGGIETGDVVLFSSTRLLRYLSKTDLAKYMAKANIQNCLNDLKDAVSNEILGRVGLTGMKFATADKADEAVMSSEEDNQTKSFLESNAGDVIAKKETLTGRFFTALKGYKDSRKPKAKVFEPGRSSGMLAGIGGGLRNFFGSLFSSGFGKNKILALLVVVIVVLMGGIWYASSQSATRAELEALDQTLVGVQERIEEAETKGAYDKESAKTILDRAYSDAITVLNSGYYRDKAKSYLVKIDQVRDSLDNVIRVESPTVVADLSAKRSDVNALGVVAVGDRVFAYEYNALYEIVLDQVQDPLTIDDEEVVIDATGFEDRGSVVFLTKSGQLIEYKDGTMSFMDSADGSFRKGTSIKDWSNRIYLLDPAGNQLWRYTYRGTSDSFSEAEGYVVDDEADLSKVQDFAIDASVYMLGSDGTLDKYYGGSKVDLQINNEPFNAFKDPRVVYTNDKLSEVYVMDGKEARVLVFTKEAQSGNLTYKSQYLFDGVGELRDLYVDPESNKLRVLTASKLLETELQ